MLFKKSIGKDLLIGRLSNWFIPYVLEEHHWSGRSLLHEPLFKQIGIFFYIIRNTYKRRKRPNSPDNP